MDNSTVILLVEDEVLVRMVVADVLSEAGFTVLESASAEEALRLLETRPDVQVLFTDVNMPGALDGLGLAQTVHERSPGVGILIGSGRIRPGVGELPVGARFITKPYAPSTLTDAVRAVARGHRGRDEHSSGRSNDEAIAPSQTAEFVRRQRPDLSEARSSSGRAIG